MNLMLTILLIDITTNKVLLFDIEFKFQIDKITIWDILPAFLTNRMRPYK